MKKSILVLSLLGSCLLANAQQRKLSDITLPEADTLLVKAQGGWLSVDTRENYMRIVMDAHVNVANGEDNALIFQLPCSLDGYYFGPDAKRYKNINIQISNDETVKATWNGTEMSDEEDFPTNTLCVVESQVELDRIVCLNPGTSTQVTALTGPGAKDGNTLGYLAMPLKTYLDDLSTKIQQIQENPTTGNKKVYDLFGREINRGQKGIQIINGKKTLVR